MGDLPAAGDVSGKEPRGANADEGHCVSHRDLDGCVAAQLFDRAGQCPEPGEGEAVAKGTVNARWEVGCAIDACIDRKGKQVGTASLASGSQPEPSTDSGE